MVCSGGGRDLPVAGDPGPNADRAWAYGGVAAV